MGLLYNPIVSYEPLYITNFGWNFDLWIAEVPTIRIRPRRGPSWSGWAWAYHVQWEAEGSSLRRGFRDPIHTHMLQLHCCLALPRQHAPRRCSPTVGSVPHLWRWEHQRYDKLWRNRTIFYPVCVFACVWENMSVAGCCFLQLATLHHQSHKVKYFG